MSFYVDTSVIVAAITPEPHTDAAHAWLSSVEPASLVLSGWVFAEVQSALCRKVRMGRMSAEHRALAHSQFTRMVADSFTIVTVEERHFGRAAYFAEHHESGLRAGDALHLAISSERGLTLCTLDRTLAEAGLLLGVPTLLL